MYEISEVIKEYMEQERGNIDLNKINEGFKILEEFVNIPAVERYDFEAFSFSGKELDNMTKNFGNFKNYLTSNGIYWEHFLRKLYYIRYSELLDFDPKADTSMGKYYKKLVKFYDWTEENEIKAARSKDEENKSGLFAVGNANPDVYANCPHYIEHYIRAYHFRNKAAHARMVSDSKEMKNYAFSMMLCILDMCCRYKQLIQEFAEKRKNSLAVKENAEVKKEKKFEAIVICNQLRELLSASENENVEEAKESASTFVEMQWSLTEFAPKMKFVGEPGTGKTTQMRQIYINELLRGDTLPIWISIKDIESRDDGLSKKMTEVYEDICKLDLTSKTELPSLTDMLENGSISLFLDGYDEYRFDGQETAKHFAQEIKTTVSKCKKAYISDRNKDANLSISMKDVKICEPKYFKRDDINLFAQKYYTDKPEYLSAISAYINCKEDSDWLNEAEKVKITPLMIINLMDLICDSVDNDGELPKDYIDYSIMYTDYVIKREHQEKGVKKDILDAMETVLGQMAVYIMENKVEPTANINKMKLADYLNKKIGTELSSYYGDKSEYTINELLQRAKKLRFIGDNGPALFFEDESYYNVFWGKLVLE